LGHPRYLNFFQPGQGATHKTLTFRKQEKWVGKKDKSDSTFFVSRQKKKNGYGRQKT